MFFWCFQKNMYQYNNLISTKNVYFAIKFSIICHSDLSIAIFSYFCKSINNKEVLLISSKMYEP